MPKISVILPAYNAERYIAAAVNSVLAQTFGDFEFIIVNDGSTDRTEAILRKIAMNDSRVRLISRPNTGYVPALKEAIDAAHGKYLARMDADDIAHRERFARQVDLLDRQRDVTVVGTSYELIDARGRHLHEQHQPTDDGTLQRHCLAGTTPICHPTAMFRRDAYYAVGGYDASACPAEDLDLWLRLGEVGRLACLPELLLQYRLHADSVSETKQAKQIDSARRTCEAAAERRGITSLFKAADWRESVGQAGRLRQTLKYGWWAFNSGERKTAMTYGVKAVGTSPTSVAAWKLLGCGVLKPMPAGVASHGGTGFNWLAAWFGRPA
ncbi:MAG: glycosyltransferase family 2 protein [Tepidisphaeraceae bacterium]